MALTGIQILKMLPKKNCGECDIPTCLAFAMKVAAGQVEIGVCPYVSDDVKEQIGEASAPPIRTIKLGEGDDTFTMGGEKRGKEAYRDFVKTAVAGNLDLRFTVQDEIHPRPVPRRR